MKRLTLTTAFLLCLSPLAAWCAEPDSHRQAAAELLKVMNMENSMIAAASSVLDAQAQSNPGLAPYRDVIQKWLNKYLTWEAVGPRMTVLYEEAFTEPEIRDMIAFYKTPTGQKTLAKMPVLLQQGMQIGMEVTQQHKAELETMIHARGEELEKAKKKPEGGD